MKIDVFTYTDEDEKVTATFEVSPNLIHHDMLDAWFYEARLFPFSGAPKQLTEKELRGLKIFDELVSDACEKFSPSQHEEETAANAADQDL